MRILRKTSEKRILTKKFDHSSSARTISNSSSNTVQIGRFNLLLKYINCCERETADTSLHAPCRTKSSRDGESEQ